jgi:hypothetical protein
LKKEGVPIDFVEPFVEKRDEKELTKTEVRTLERVVEKREKKERD